MTEGGPTLAEVAGAAGVSVSTLRRWIALGLVAAPTGDGLPRVATAQARVVARLRDRGHALTDIRAATESGRLAFAIIEDLLPSAPARHSLTAVAADTGLEPALVRRILRALGLGIAQADRLSDDDVALLRRFADVLAAGFPLVAVLQLARVYGLALSQIADAEVRLFHIYVHEPLIRDGTPGWEVADAMGDLARAILPMASPIMEDVHRRFLQHFVEQDQVGHMEAAADGTVPELGRVRVAIAFADLAGYTRLTEEVGEDEAVSAVERFVERVEETLPDEARVIKTIGDEVMVVGADARSLVDWAVAFQDLSRERPRPRIGMHHGEVLYRDGDFYGREVNLAARVAARAAGGEVLVTRAVVAQAGTRLVFEPIGGVQLKGFADATEIFLARATEDA